MRRCCVGRDQSITMLSAWKWWCLLVELCVICSFWNHNSRSEKQLVDWTCHEWNSPTRALVRDPIDISKVIYAIIGSYKHWLTRSKWPIWCMGLTLIWSDQSLGLQSPSLMSLWFWWYHDNNWFQLMTKNVIKLQLITSDYKSIQMHTKWFQSKRWFVTIHRSTGVWIMHDWNLVTYVKNSYVWLVYACA